MAGRIIGCLCGILCAAPFLFLGYLAKSSRDPIAFFTGDNSLKGIIGDVQGYNAAMGTLYSRYGLAFFISAVLCAVIPMVGFTLLMLCSTLGIFIVYRHYKKNVQAYKKSPA